MDQSGAADDEYYYHLDKEYRFGVLLVTRLNGTYYEMPLTLFDADYELWKKYKTPMFVFDHMPEGHFWVSPSGDKVSLDPEYTYTLICSGKDDWMFEESRK